MQKYIVFIIAAILISCNQPVKKEPAPKFDLRALKFKYKKEYISSEFDFPESESPFSAA